MQIDAIRAYTAIAPIICHGEWPIAAAPKSENTAVPRKDIKHSRLMTALPSRMSAIHSAVATAGATTVQAMKSHAATRSLPYANSMESMPATRHNAAQRF